MNGAVFLGLIVLSELLLIVAIYKSFGRNYLGFKKALILGSLILMLVIDNLGISPLLFEIGARWWWYLLLLNPFLSIVSVFYMFYTDRKLALLVIPQVVFSIVGFLLAYQILTHGVNLNMMF